MGGKLGIPVEWCSCKPYRPTALPGLRQKEITMLGKKSIRGCAHVCDLLKDEAVLEWWLWSGVFGVAHVEGS